MIYDPKPTKYPLPDYTDGHYLEVEKKFDFIFDDKYPYVDTSKKFKRKQRWVRLGLRTMVFPFAPVKIGLRIKGRKIIKKHKELIKNGVISVANHIHPWDYISVMKAARPGKTNILVWNENVNGPSGGLVRLVGGIPIPEHDFAATVAFKQSVDNLLNNGGWLHVCPEGSMWEYYQPIRPFKHGAFYFARKLDKPIIPMAFSYRRPSWIRKHIFRQPAAVTLTIGEPLFVNKELDVNKQEEDLLIRCHDAVCLLAGIDPKDNIYEPVFHDSKRIDYYSDTYGSKNK